MLRKKTELVTLSFFLFGLFVVSPNGYNTIEAAPKTFFEGFLLCLLSLLLFGFLRNRDLKVTSCDYLLLIPTCFFFMYGALGAFVSTLHPTLIFLMAFCGVTLSRNVNPDSLQKSLLITALALSICGFLWFINNNMTISLIEVFNSTEPWGYDESVRFPIFVINQYGGFAQRNIFSVLLATSVLLLIQLCHTKTIQIMPCSHTLPILIVFANSYFLALLGSLTASLGLAIGAALLAIDLFKTHKWQIKSTLLFSALCAGYFATLLEPSVDSLVITEKLSSTNSSTKCRLLWWSFNVQQIFANPFFGSGLDTFSGVFMEYAYANDGILDFCDASPSHSHNGILHLASETGLVGLILVASPLLLWVLLNSVGKNLLVIIGLLSPIGLHTQTEWPLHASMVVWSLLLIIPIAFSNVQQPQKQLCRPIKLFMLTSITLTSAYLISVLGAQRGVALERYVIERSDRRAQIQLMVNSRYRFHPAFKSIYDIAINRALIEIAITEKNPNALKLVIPELKKSIGPLAGHTEIKLLLTARKLITELQSHQK